MKLVPPRFGAVIDLGSNSFRMVIAAVGREKVYPLQEFKETLRLGADLDENGYLTEQAQSKVIECLCRFARVLRSSDIDRVRAVATHVFRQAPNGADVLRRAEKVLGYPIEIISGEQEAQWIYQGVMHSLPPSHEKRLVIDIGGGSTECITGCQSQIFYLHSFKMGCVSWTERYFKNGKSDIFSFKEAEFAAKHLLIPIKDKLCSTSWDNAYASLGSVRVLKEVFEDFGWEDCLLSWDNLQRLKGCFVKAGSLKALHCPSLPKERLSVLPGGLALLIVLMETLAIEEIFPANGALQLGVLYDLFVPEEHYDNYGKNNLSTSSLQT